MQVQEIAGDLLQIRPGIANIVPPLPFDEEPEAGLLRQVLGIVLTGELAAQLPAQPLDMHADLDTGLDIACLFGTFGGHTHKDVREHETRTCVTGNGLSAGRCSAAALENTGIGDFFEIR